MIKNDCTENVTKSKIKEAKGNKPKLEYGDSFMELFNCLKSVKIGFFTTTGLFRSYVVC